MTNHPRSPRAKFKVGQIVYNRYDQEYVHLRMTDDSGDKPAWYTSGGYALEKDLRPHQERGRLPSSRQSGKVQEVTTGVGVSEETDTV